MQRLMEKYFDKLWPLPRSITGQGYQDSLDIVGELVPLNKIDFPTGTSCHNWDIPPTWEIIEAFILTPENKKICDFKKNNLHVVGYSIPVCKEIFWGLLKKFIHTVPELEEAVPYITSYYKQRWGFCMSQYQFNILDSRYDDSALFAVNIDSTLKPGVLTVADAFIEGKTTREILLSTYLCHPSLANDNLSGPLVWAMAYQELKKFQLEHTIRFYIGPENIGAVAYLSAPNGETKIRDGEAAGGYLNNGEYLGEHLDAGYVVNCVGLGSTYSYKESRRGNTLADRAARNVLDHIPKTYEKQIKFIEFSPDGSDERQFCSPGYNLPVGVFMRTPHWMYQQYHTSLDNKDLISFETLEESVHTLVEIVLTTDRGDEKWIGTVQYGTPQFSKCSEDIYESTMKLNSFLRPNFNRKLLLDLCNFCDGENSLLDIAERRNYKLLEMLPMISKLWELGLLRRLK